MLPHLKGGRYLKQLTFDEKQDADDASVVSLLRELLKLVRVSSYGQVKLTLEGVFPKKEGGSEPLNDSVRKDVMLYELADGTRQQKELGSMVGMSQASVSKKLARWGKIGLVEGRTAAFDLLDFGFLDLRPEPRSGSGVDTPVTDNPREAGDGA
jgi:hypothetical protein